MSERPSFFASQRFLIIGLVLRVPVRARSRRRQVRCVILAIGLFVEAASAYEPLDLRTERRRGRVQEGRHAERDSLLIVGLPVS